MLSANMNAALHPTYPDFPKCYVKAEKILHTKTTLLSITLIED